MPAGQPDSSGGRLDSDGRAADSVGVGGGLGWEAGWLAGRVAAGAGGNAGRHIR
jgi:hypothetical protein